MAAWTRSSSRPFSTKTRDEMILSTLEARQAASMWERSGAFIRVKGVGTQITAASACAHSRYAVLARNRPQYAVDLVPAELPSNAARRAEVLATLGQLTGNHPASLDAAADQGMRSRDPFAPIRLRAKL